MSVSYSLTVAMKMTTIITKSAAEIAAQGEHTITANAWDTSVSLNASSTPAVTKVLKKTQGNGTLDLTAAVDDDADVGTLDMSGLKCQSVLIVNDADNSNTCTISDPANAYSLNGGANIVLAPGEKFQLYCPETKSDVDASNKNLAFAIAGGESVYVMMAFG